MQKNSLFVKFIAFFSLLFLNFAFFVPMNNCDISAEGEGQTSATAMVVMEQSSGRVLYAKNEDEKLPMASTTKIITAIFVLEHCEDLQKVVCIPKEAVGISGTSIGLKEGEHLTILELLYGLMLRSGNDSAVALAIETCGNEENFVAQANEFLKEIGASNTHICNPHGLTQEGHYTTASDLAKITAYAMNNKTFKEIVSAKEQRISNELESKYSRNLINKNKLLKTYDFADGVKTGFTSKAGRCFVGSATKNNMQLICVLLNCVPMFEDCKMLLEKGFDEYEMCHLLEKGMVYETSDVGRQQNVVCDVDFFYPLSKEEKGSVTLSVSSDMIDCFSGERKSEDCTLMQINLGKQLIFSHKIYNINNEENDTSFQSGLQKIIKKM